MRLNFSIDWTELSIQWMLTCGHFLWQGFAVAIVIILVERLATVRRRSAGPEASEALLLRPSIADKNQRNISASTCYALACFGLLTLPVCVILTFARVHSTRGSFFMTARPTIDNAVRLSHSDSISANVIEHEKPTALSGNGPLLTQTLVFKTDQDVKNEAVSNVTDSFSQSARFIAPMIFVAYAIVVGLLLLRLGLSLVGSFRFRNTARPVSDPQLLQMVLTQATRLKLKAVPVVALCMRVSSPVVVGIVRPMILLPPSLLCGLDPTQLAAILSHEMAHIRRYDLLFNLVQRIIESLFFFHPVTWWLSRRVTIERENCCDDVAASCVGRLTYAEALVQMASICLAKHRSRSQALAMLAADGGCSTDFGYRIRRLIDAQDSPQIRFTKRAFAIGLVTSVFIWASLSTLAQGPQANKKETPMNKPIDDRQVDGIQWSTWGDHDGLLSGARLILPEGGVHPGQPFVVEYRLKNVSSETKKLACYVRGNRTHLTLGSNNLISDMGIDTPENPIEFAIEPGKEYVATSYKASVDTHGLFPGDYQVALGSAFFYPDAVNLGSKHEIPHRGSIPLKILGEPNSTINRPLDNSIHWGDAISGLRLGSKFHSATNNLSIGDVVEADLWIANVSSQVIHCSIRLPHPMDGWLFNVENQLGDTIMLERPPMVSIFSPQRFYSLQLAPGEIKAITGDRIDEQPEKFAGRRAKFEIAGANEDQGWGDHTIKSRLVTQGGDYKAIFNVMLDRPDVPGMGIELDSGCTFTVGQPIAAPKVTQVLDEATDESILWGEPVGGMRLGIRQSEFDRRRVILRHGEHIDYEVWIKNETDEVVRIARDPSINDNPKLRDNGSIDVVGWSIAVSFLIPQEEFVKAELILPPRHAARRFLSHQHSASIRPPGSPRGRFGPEPLHLKPGKYPVFAQVGDLKSGVEEVAIIPAARLQIRKSSRPTDRSRMYAAADPSDAILSWQAGNGEKQEVLINWDGGVFMDERDLATVEIVQVEGQPDQYTIALKLQRESASWLSRRIAMYSLWDDPGMVTILLDGKPLGALNIPSPIPDDKLIIPTHFSGEQAEATINEIKAAMAVPIPRHQ